MRIISRPFRLDSVGAAAAATCGAHCLVVPPLLAILPMPSFRAIADPRIEWSLLAISMSLGAIGLIPSYLRCHGCPNPLMWFAIGAFLLLGTQAAVTEASSARAWLLAGGGVCLFLSHRLNARLCCRCANG
jgi:MerC mercury resistance protein